MGNVIAFWMMMNKEVDMETKQKKATFVCIDEIYTAFFECECGCQDIQEYFKFCPSCGCRIEIPEEEIEKYN